MAMVTMVWDFEICLQTLNFIMIGQYGWSDIDQYWSESNKLSKPFSEFFFFKQKLTFIEICLSNADWC